MNKKGFTLIELLAVIVVLAIIALIATPMILNVVEKARKGAAKSSALGYVDAVEKQIMVNQLNENPEINDGEYELPIDNTYKVSVKGAKPSSGTLTITKSKVVSASMCINNYTVIYDGKTATVGNKCSSSSNTPVASYVVTYNSNGGTGTMSNTTNEVVASTFVAPSGKTFKEWNTKADGSGDVYTSSSNVNNDIILYAIWKNIPTIDSCPGCKYVYTTSKLEIGTSTLSEGTTEDYTTLTSPYFLGLIANESTGVIERAFACGVEGTTPFCLEGYDTTKYSSNIDILNAVYPSCGASASKFYASCSGSSMGAYTDNRVHVSVYYGDDGCYVDFEGFANCGE